MEELSKLFIYLLKIIIYIGIWYTIISIHENSFNFVDWRSEVTSIFTIISIIIALATE